MSRSLVGVTGHVHIVQRLLVDSMVVHVLMAYHATCVRLSSLKPFFGTSLKHELRFSDTVGAEAPGSQ